MTVYLKHYYLDVELICRWIPVPCLNGSNICVLYPLPPSLFSDSNIPNYIIFSCHSGFYLFIFWLNGVPFDWIKFSILNEVNMQKICNLSYQGRCQIQTKNTLDFWVLKMLCCQLVADNYIKKIFKGTWLLTYICNISHYIEPWMTTYMELPPMYLTDGTSTFLDLNGYLMDHRGIIFSSSQWRRCSHGYGCFDAISSLSSIWLWSISAHNRRFGV